MNEIERLNPGLVVRASGRPEAAIRRSVALIGKNPKVVLASLADRQGRGEIESAGALQLITTGPHAGQYAVRVVLLPGRPPVKWPARCAAVGSVLVGVAALLLAARWFLVSLSGASLVLLCFALLGGLGALVMRGRRESTTVTVVQNVSVGR